MMLAASIFGVSYLVIALLAMAGLAWFFWNLNKPSTTMFGKADDYTTTDCTGFEAIATVLLGLAWPALLLVIIVSKIESWRIRRRYKKLRDPERFDDGDIPF